MLRRDVHRKKTSTPAKSDFDLIFGCFLCTWYSNGTLTVYFDGFFFNFMFPNFWLCYFSAVLRI